MPTKRASRAARKRAEAKGRPPRPVTLRPEDFHPFLDFADALHGRSGPKAFDPTLNRPMPVDLVVIDDHPGAAAAQAVLRRTLSNERISAEVYHSIVMDEVTTELEAAVRDFVTRKN